MTMLGKYENVVQNQPNFQPIPTQKTSYVSLKLYLIWYPNFKVYKLKYLIKKKGVFNSNFDTHVGYINNPKSNSLGSRTREFKFS